MGTRSQDNPQDNKKKQPNFGELPDLDDLLMFAELNDSDVDDAVMWLEDKAPDVAKKIGKSE